MTALSRTENGFMMSHVIWPFQVPQLEVPAIYVAAGRMGICPQNVAADVVQISILGSPNSHWLMGTATNVSLVQYRKLLPKDRTVHSTNNEKQEPMVSWANTHLYHVCSASPCLFLVESQFFCSNLYCWFAKCLLNPNSCSLNPHVCWLNPFVENQPTISPSESAPFSNFRFWMIRSLEYLPQGRSNHPELNGGYSPLPIIRARENGIAPGSLNIYHQLGVCVSSHCNIHGPTKLAALAYRKKVMALAFKNLRVKREKLGISWISTSQHCDLTWKIWIQVS